MLKKAWRFITRIGVVDGYDDNLIKRIELTNQFSIVAMIVFFFSGINNYFLKDYFSAALIETFVLICLLAFYFNHKGYHTFAISYIFTMISLAIFYFDSYSGVLSGTYLYYFPLVFAIGFIFDFQENRIAIRLHYLLVIFFSMFNVITKHELFRSDFINDDIRAQMFIFNLLFSILSVGFFIYLTNQNNKNLSNAYNQRITERKQSEDAIKLALLEKEVLLAELHHRVKNNLAVITGLFNFKLNADIHQDARNVLLESKNRVQSMALIHNLLYKNSNLVDINIENYLKDLISEIQSSYPDISNTIVVHKNISAFNLDINTAVPCGLIINEVLTNCYKHAFVNRTKGEIKIRFTKSGSLIQLVLKDDGVGLKDNYQNGGSIGLTVIEALSGQLGAKHSFYNSESGAAFELAFTDSQHKN